MKKRSGNLIFIAVILILDFVISLGWIIGTAMKVKEISGLETPKAIAAKYMKTEYDAEWIKLEDVWYAGRDNHLNTQYVYQITRDNEKTTYPYVTFKIYKDLDIIDIWGTLEKQGIICARRTDSLGMTIKSVYPCHGDYIENIWGTINVYNATEEQWEDQYYEIFYVDGRYILEEYKTEDNIALKPEEFEKTTGMTIQEIVDIAHEDQKELEETMYEMQGHMLEKRKASMWKKLLWTNGISLILIGLGIVSEIIERRYAE